MAQQPHHASKLDDSASGKRAPADPFSHGRAPPPSPADLLFSDGQLVPHLYVGAAEARRSQLPSSNGDGRRSSSASPSGGRGCLIKKDGDAKNTAVTPKRVSFLLNETGRRSASSQGSAGVNRSNGRARKKTTEKQQQVRVFGFLVSACRECHAFQPSKYAEPRKNPGKIFAA
ncbi:hypothetical protein GW17_00005893 [Ensete ventricosum]|nr:hypothetical protein GW17_00005893 [Ensete ventricosum]